MRINAATGFPLPARDIFPRGGPRVVEKISAVSALRREPGDTPTSRHQQDAERNSFHAYQNETGAIVPLRDRVRLSSAFVAQLLGQVLAQERTSPASHLAAARAYDGPHTPGTHLLSRQD